MKGASKAWPSDTGNIDWFDREALCALSTVPTYIYSRNP